MSKCKTCGRTISYGYGNNYWNSFEQKVGKVNKDSWKKAIEQNCTISADTDKNISYKVNNIPEKIYETGGYYEEKACVFILSIELYECIFCTSLRLFL